jgi:hypothetical protein
VLIVVVGPRWLDGRVGQRRIDDPDDWVHAEIVEALSHDIPVVPVLLGGARLDRARMPPALAPLVDRQYFEIRDRRQRMHIHNLADYLTRQIPQLNDLRTSAGRGARPRDWFTGRWAVVALSVTLLLVMAIPAGKAPDVSEPPAGSSIDVLAVKHNISLETDRIITTIRNNRPEPVLIKQIGIFLAYSPAGSGHDWADDEPA